MDELTEEKPVLTKYYYVMRTYTHSDIKQLWKVMSRPMKNKQDAQGWLEWCEFSETNPEHKFFLVTREE